MCTFLHALALDFVLKLYIPSTINTWKKLLSKAICADKKCDWQFLEYLGYITFTPLLKMHFFLPDASPLQTMRMQMRFWRQKNTASRTLLRSIINSSSHFRAELSFVNTNLTKLILVQVWILLGLKFEQLIHLIATI